jgi:hypothetical protein
MLQISRPFCTAVSAGAGRRFNATIFIKIALEAIENAMPQRRAFSLASSKEGPYPGEPPSVIKHQ